MKTSPSATTNVGSVPPVFLNIHCYLMPTGQHIVFLDVKK